MIFYRICRGLCKIICKLFVWLKVENKEKMIHEGPVIVAANHESAFDVAMVTVWANRKIYWMAKESIFRFKPLGALFRYWGGYPVKRNSHDTGAAAKTFELLEKGEAVGIFIQGTRARGKGREVKARHGAVKFAERADCPIIPVAIVGKAGLFRKVKVIYGDPITIPKGEYSNDEYREIAQKILDGIYDIVDREKANGNYKS